MCEVTSAMNAQKIIMAFQLVNPVVATRKEAKMMLVTSIVEIVIVCQMLVVKHVTNVNVIILELLQIAKVHVSNEEKLKILQKTLLDFRM